MDADARAALDVMLSEQEITRLVHEYCHGIDKRDPDRFLAQASGPGGMAGGGWEGANMTSNV